MKKIYVVVEYFNRDEDYFFYEKLKDANNHAKKYMLYNNKLELKHKDSEVFAIPYKAYNQYLEDDNFIFHDYATWDNKYYNSKRNNI